ncbi:MAG: lysine--tRNA ligase [Mycoplasmoidaceae bacterium]
MKNNNYSKKINDQEIIRREKLIHLQNINENPYKIENSKVSFFIGEFVEKYTFLKKLPDKIFCLSGRVMALRQTFGVLQSLNSKIQFYLNKKTFPPKKFIKFKKYIDIGDIIEIKGTLFRTNKGELTINLINFRLLSKSLKPLPEKFHGLQDEELRSRNRYIDLIMNQQSINTFILRSKIISLIRNYFDSNGYLEMETPVLNPRLGGANALPFITHHNALKRDYYLRIATELPLKKLIVGGFEKIYEIGRIFRNEGMDSTHNPEFTSIECYTAYSSMKDLFKIVENLIKFIAKKLNKKNVILGGNNINLVKKFKIIHMVDFIKQEANVDFWNITDINEALSISKQHLINVQKHQFSVGHIINLFFEKYCESKCIDPVFVWGHPIEVSPLSKIDFSNLRFTKRFELFINGKEITNAFAELNDPIDQKKRFLDQIKEKELGNNEACEMDEDFINALEYGLPPTGGFGIGIDRLVMIFSEKNSIRDVLLFPHMKEK